MTQAQDNPTTDTNTDNDNANDNANANAKSVSSSLTARSGIIGTQIGALFALCFFFIGYSIYLSLFLGAIAAVAISAMTHWWESDDETSETIQASFSDEEIYGLRKRNRRHRQKRYLQARNSYLSRRERKPLTGLFFETGVAQLPPPNPSRTESAPSADNADNNEGNSGDE